MAAAYLIVAGVISCLLYFILFVWLWFSIVDDVNRADPSKIGYLGRLAWWWPPYSVLLIRVHQRHYPSSRKGFYFRLVRGVGIIAGLVLLFYMFSDQRP